MAVASAKAALDKGEYRSAVDTLSDVIARGETDAARTLVKEYLESFKNSSKKGGEASMLISKAQLALAAHDGDEALRVAKESVTVAGFAQEKKDLEGPAYKVLFGACVMKGKLPEAKTAAQNMLAAGNKYKDQETIAGASLASASVLSKLEDPGLAMEAAESALKVYTELESAKGKASAYTTMAKIQYSMPSPNAEDGISVLEQAIPLWCTAGYTKGLASALELLVQGYSMKDSPHAALVRVHKELEVLKAASNVRGQADLLEMLARTHALLGEPVSALNYAKDAVSLYQGLQDKMGEASLLYMMAEMYRAQSDMAYATVWAEKALKIFRSLGSKWGEEQCRTLLSSLHVVRGQPEKAPNKSLALKTLSQMVKAMEARKEEDFKMYEKQIYELPEGLITEQDVDDVLFQALERDPDAVEWLEDTAGWEFPKKPGEPQTIHIWSKRLFYLQHLFGGMGFGPNFRHVNPYRVGKLDPDPKKEKPVAICVSEMEPTDEWTMGLKYHPGPLDSFQVLLVQAMEHA